MSFTTLLQQALRIVLVSATLLASTVAFADALVHVQVRNPSNEPVDGSVTLRPRAGGDQTYRCQTEGGDCDIHGVPPGLYTVTFAPPSGEATPPRNVVVPEGRVTLRVAAQ